MLTFLCLGGLLYNNRGAPIPLVSEAHYKGMNILGDNSFKHTGREEL